MKQHLLTLLLTPVLLLALAGCSAAGVEQRLDNAGDRIENRMDTVEETVENALRRAIPSPADAQTQPAPVPTESETTVTTVTQAQAENIALNHVGFTSDQVQRLHTEYEIDNGVPQYDVEFHHGEWEYEFEIHAQTGTIISYDRDHKYD